MAYKFNPISKKLDLVSEATEVATLPTTASNGDMAFQQSDNTLYIWYNGWIQLGANFAIARYGTASYGASTYASPPAAAVYA